MKKYSYSFLLAFSISLLFSRCTEEHVIAMKPETVVVQKTVPPFTDAVWVEPEYRWDGRTYVIVPAHWEKPNGSWVPGHWKQTSKGYVWIAGHWRRR